MKNGYTHIVAIIDRSGSMGHLRNDVINGFDIFIKEQKEADGTATMTLVQFDDKYEVNYEFTDIQEVPKFEYYPRGYTAMLDAIGKAINATGISLDKMDESERPEKVVVMIQTDGEENYSKEYSASIIKEMITHQEEDYNWEFVFLGANIDVVDTAVTLGIKIDNAIKFANNNQGMTSAINSVSENLASYRCGAKSTMCYEQKDITAQANAGV